MFIHLLHCHFPHNGEYWEGAEINRQKDRIEASKICIDIIKQSPFPLILGGDLNAHIGDTEIKMISNYLTWSLYVVPKPFIDIGRHSLLTYDTIDLIFSRPNTYYGIFGPYSYKHIYLEENNGRVSDHDPIHVKFSLLLPEHKWVRCLFLDLLNRDPGSGGIFFDLLQKGTSKGAIADGILNSPEHCTIVTNSLYQKYLERQSDPGGLQYYANMLSHGTPIQSVIISICDSPEFKNKYPGPYEYTRALYNKILERAPEAGAVENTPLRSGVTTTDYIRGFLTSPEYASKVITSYYNKYLGRAPEPGAVEGGIPRLQHESLQQIIRGFLVSDEYQQRSLSRLP
jgi:hypothetical protein